MGLEFQQANGSPKPMKSGGPKLTPAELKQLADSWSKLEDTKRVLRGKGLPKPIEPEQKKKASPAATFTE